MAKKLISDYTFVPYDPNTLTGGTVSIKDNISGERILLITNVTDNEILYNFSDPTKGFNPPSANDTGCDYDKDFEQTVISLQADTSTMAATDQLQIFVESESAEFEPSETLVDPVSKLRVSNPETMIDTDFEYGPQATKWETLQLVNNIPSTYSATSDTTIPFIETVEVTALSDIVTVTTLYEHSLTSGIPIVVSGLASTTAEGSYLIQSVPSATTFTYKARATQAISANIAGSYTSIIPGLFYEGSAISLQNDKGILADTFEYAINVVNVGGQNYFGIDGTPQGNNIFTVNKNGMYIFKLDDATNIGHPFRFSTTADGIHGGGVAYTDGVYVNGTEGTAGAYVRIYVTANTPATLYAYDAQAGNTGVGFEASFSPATTSKVVLSTEYENGFADGTALYFVNTISPKILSVANTTATAADGRPVVDYEDNISTTITPDMAQFQPWDHKPTGLWTVNDGDVDYTSKTVTLTGTNANYFRSRYCLLYYPNPGDYCIENLQRNGVYHARVESTSSANGGTAVIKLSNAYFEASNGGNPGQHGIINLRNDGGSLQGTQATYNYGKHNFALVHRYVSDEKPWWNWYWRYRWASWNWGSTNSGRDFNDISDNRGISNSNWNRTYFLTMNRRQYNGNGDLNNSNYDGRFNLAWYHGGNAVWGWSPGWNYDDYLPESPTTLTNGDFNPLYDRNNYRSNRYRYNYSLNGNDYGYHFRYGYSWWNAYRQPHGSWVWNHGNDYYGNAYIMLVQDRSNDDDTFYVENHGAVTNDQIVITKTAGNDPRYYNGDNDITTLSLPATVYAEKVDDNRFRIKEQTWTSPYRLIDAIGTYGMTGIFANPMRNSIYYQNHNLSNGERLFYTTAGTSIGNLTPNTQYYVKVATNDRFALGTSSSFTYPGGENDLTSAGSGTQVFENQTAAFGATDGAYNVSEVKGETQLVVDVPFQIVPTTKTFDARDTGSGGIVDTTNHTLQIEDHFMRTGQRVIYQDAGGTTIGGLTDNRDYFVIVVDQDHIKLAESTALAVAGTNVTLTTGGSQTPLQKLIHTNMDGQVVGNGNIAVTTGSRVATGTDTTFTRYFKVGDTFRYVNNDSATTFTIVETTISAIKDDTELLMADAATFTTGGNNSAGNTEYFIDTAIYVRPDGYFLHRPFDGGMDIGTSKSPDGQIVRQTRRYFRYQSGKGIQVSLAINFAPKNPSIRAWYSPYVDGVVMHRIVVQTKLPHNLEVGTQCEFVDATDNSYNGAFPIDYVYNAFTFSYNIDQAPTSSAAGGFTGYHVLTWSNSNVRAGMFDFQNGMFFEYDGNVLNAVRRSSTTQLTGRVSVTRGSNVVTGSDTSFLSQLSNGEYIVIRGQSHKVIRVVNNESVIIQPQYKGITAANIILTKTIDTKIPQGEWNIDRCDGSGKSGFILDITKIQMAYMDYSWYGAGKIRFGFKDQNGHVKYIHEFKHNNRLTEAYFRSGNLPARYEIHNTGIPTYIPSLFHWGTSVITDGRFDSDKAYLFTASGNLLKFTNEVSQSSQTQQNSQVKRQYDLGEGWSRNQRFYVRLFFNTNQASVLTQGTTVYNSSVANGWFVDGRSIYRSRISGGNLEVDFQYIDTNGNTTFQYNQGVSIINNALGNPAVPNSTQFAVGAPSGTDNTVPSQIPLVSIRLSPSVDSSLSGNLGEREIINRMQLQLNSLDVVNTHECEVKLILNPSLSTDSYLDVAPPSLSQLIKHTNDDTYAGGLEIFSFRAAGGGIDNSGNRLTGATSYDISSIIEMGNSILGGDGIFPNGPDLLTVTAEPVDLTGVSNSNPFTVTGRISWSESQA